MATEPSFIEQVLTQLETVLENQKESRDDISDIKVFMGVLREQQLPSRVRKLEERVPKNTEARIRALEDNQLELKTTMKNSARIGGFFGAIAGAVTATVVGGILLKFFINNWVASAANAATTAIEAAPK